MEAQALSTVNIEDEMRQSYMDYAMSVIIGRALPDVRDGLKPVQRRVLYAMLSEGLVSTRKTSKCAGVVGEVLKKYHPHGDSSVYDALVRLAQPWNLRYPLVDGQGNFGSVDGDPAAAYRYTECRMTALSEKLLADIEKDTVDFIPNFDETTDEPVVLPSVFPNLLVNGGDGIAVGMATHIPPHNLGEVINGTIALIQNPQITCDELMTHIPGPDFPTGGEIEGTSSIISAYRTGRGVLKVRAKHHLETLKKKSREVEAIIVTEIPFQLNKARLVEKIAALMNDKAIEGISDLRDESDRSGMRIVIEVKRDSTVDVVLNQLYTMTPMRSSFGVINLAIVEGRPVICTLIQMLSNFIDHRRDVITRRTVYELKKAQARMHLLEGFRIALLNLDAVIALIKGSSTPEDARNGLIREYSLSEIQAQAILELRLQKLTGMERLAIEQEHKELAAFIDSLRAILADPAKVDAIIVKELGEIRDQFSDPRRTAIVEGGGEELIHEDLIEDEEMVVTISHKGYIKRTPVTEYRAQRRGGKGVVGAVAKDDDFVEHLFVNSSKASVLIFTSFGKLYWKKVYEFPVAGRAARGRALVNLLDLKEGEENLTAILPLKEFNENRFVVMCTSQGIIKKTSLVEFSRQWKNGIIACSLDDGDALVSVGISHGSDDVIVGTRHGMAIRFSEEGVRAMGRTARGVRSIKLDEGDQVVSMTLVAAANGDDATDESEGRVGANGTLLTVCENGYGKRTELSQYKVQGRGGKGLIDIQTNERNGNVVDLCAVTDEKQLMLITSGGQIIRTFASDVSVIGRNTQGVRLIDLAENETVVAVADLEESENGDVEVEDDAE